jgi:hypothetical protein
MSPVEYCACGHAKGDHRASGSLSLIVTFGRCLVDGCDCRVFTVHVDTEEARDAA